MAWRRAYTDGTLRRVDPQASTLLVDRAGRELSLRAPSYQLVVVAGPDRGLDAPCRDGRLSVGTDEGVGLRLTDRTVSRFHAELEATEQGVVLRDLGSTNGTALGGALVREVVLRDETEIRIGQSRVRLVFDGHHQAIPTSVATTFGRLSGASPGMRQVFTLLERAAPTNAPVLLTGESGTGKELAARAIHDGSPRRDGPFEIVDCGALPPTLIESELFGHERGAFTHATVDREGAFERADGGTLFLDELGELALELQPKLLRAVGEQRIRRLGARQSQPVDVRLVAATNRDLRREVNAGRFRGDLYYRLAVLHVRLPPLRDRVDDLQLLVPALLERIASERGIDAHIEPDPQLLTTLARHSWPGNVRELRNYLEQLVILRIPPVLPGAVDGPAAPQPSPDPGSLHDPLDLPSLERLPLRQAKGQLLERFEQRYLEHLLAHTQGNVAEAARQAGVDRGTLFRAIRRHGIKVQR